MSVTITFRMLGDLTSSVTLPELNEVTSANSAILKGTFYLVFKKNSSSSYDLEHKFEIGKIGSILNQTFNDLSEMGQTFSTPSGTGQTPYFNILFKFDNENYNNTNYNDYIKFKNTSASLNRYLKYGISPFNEFFCFPSSDGKALGNIPYNYYMSISESKDIGDIPIEPTSKSFNLTLSNNLYSNAIQSDIEFYYRISGTTDIIKLCDVLDSNTNVFTLEYLDTYSGIELLFRYKTDTLNNSTYNESLKDSNNNYAYFNSNINYFVFCDSNNNIISYNSDTTIKEVKYNYIRLNFDNINYSCNLTHLNASLYPENIILTCNNNYYFSSAPIMKVFSLGISTELLFNLNDDFTIATLEYNNDYINRVIQSYSVVIEPKTTITEKYGLISLYKPTGDILKNLSNKLFHQYILNDTVQLIDLSKYIVSFLSIPIDVETIGTKELKLCSISTGIELPYIDDNIINLDFGDITIEGIYHNSLDFKNTTIEMILPYIDTVELKPSKYMNKTINLTYRIDLFTGDTLAILKVNNIIYDTFSGKCAIEIPFISQAENKEKNTLKYVNSNLLNENIPMIIIRTNDINNKLLYSTNEYKEELNTLSGFNSLDNIELNISSDMLQNDIDSIKNLLSNGVIF